MPSKSLLAMAEVLDVTQLYKHFVSEGIHVHGAYMRILAVRGSKTRLHDNNIKFFLEIIQLLGFSINLVE